MQDLLCLNTCVNDNLVVTNLLMSSWEGCGLKQHLFCYNYNSCKLVVLPPQPFETVFKVNLLHNDKKSTLKQDPVKSSKMFLVKKE